MCGKLVNLDTVARVIADYYHLKTDTQLAALDEALSKVPAVSVGGGHGKDHVADPGKMVGDLISRAEALDALGERPVVWTDNDDYTLGARNQYDKDRLAIETVPSAQQWIPCDKGEPDEDMECWVTVKTTDALYRGYFTKRYGERRDKGFITSGGFMWWNTALAWMPIYEPEPYRPEGEDKHEG